jgi:hypothetical protein
MTVAVDARQKIPRHRPHTLRIPQRSRAYC